MFYDTRTTRRLTLRPPTPEDAQSVFEQWASDPEVTRFLLWPTHQEVEDTRAFLRGCQQAWAERDGRFPWVLTRIDDPTPVGMLELNVDGHAVSVGYVISPQFQGRGYATEALVHVIEVALGKRSIWRVWATTDVENVASARVMEKAGMQREGRLRRYAVRPQLGEEPRDAYVFAAVRQKLDAKTSGHFSARVAPRILRHGSITLRLISQGSVGELEERLRNHPDSQTFIDAVHAHYLPRYDAEGRRTKWGFYATLDGEVAGCSLLGIGSWPVRRGYTGAFTLPEMRGRGVAPGSKPHLFYLGFELLGLHRIETGCNASNLASRRSIEKTPGFEFEGTLRGYAVGEDGEFEDEYRYAILRDDWEGLYDASTVVEGIMNQL
ncbi:MAG: GNAT family N-acetyltransferase [Myxococcota bacterium]